MQELLKNYDANINNFKFKREKQQLLTRGEYFDIVLEIHSLKMKDLILPYSRLPMTKTQHIQPLKIAFSSNLKKLTQNKNRYFYFKMWIF